jgi:hypothetical protein
MTNDDIEFVIGDRVISPGAKIVSFSGTNYTFERVSRRPEPGKTGKVIARDGEGWSRELYPTVFDGKLIEKKASDA